MAGSNCPGSGCKARWSYSIASSTRPWRKSTFPRLLRAWGRWGASETAQSSTQQSSLVERARVAGVAQVLTEIRKGNGIVGLEHNSRAEGQGSLGPPVE